MNRLSIAAIAAVFGILVGYALAVTLGNTHGRSAPRTAPAAMRAAPVPFDYQAPAPKLSAEAARDHRQTHYEALASVDDVLELPTDFAQTEALYTLAGRADAEQLQDLIRESMNIAHRYDRSAALDILFSRYAELDAPAALAFLEQLDLDIDDMIAQSLFSAWVKQDLPGAVAGCNQIANVRVRKRAGYVILTTIARNDPGMLEAVAAQLSDRHDTAWIRSEMVGIHANYQPADALAQALQMNMNQGGHDAIRRVAVVWARNDPAAALGYASSIENDAQRQHFISAATGRWMEDDPDAALAALMAMPASRDKDRMLISGLGGYARSYPQEALQAVETLDGSIRTQAYQRVLLSWSQDDPDAALGALAARTLPDGVLETVIGDVARSYPEKALRFAQTLDENTRNGLLPNILSQLTATDPHRAIELARSTQAADQQARNLQLVLQQISQSNPALAARYIDELPSVDGKRQLYRQVASAMATNDPTAALAWAATLSGQAYTEAVMGMGERLAHNDPDLAASMLGQIRGAARESWIHSVTNAYARTDPRRALSWASQFKNEPGYANAISSVVFQLSRTDPQAALRVAGELPAESREHATTMALSNWADQDPRAAARYAAGTDESLRVSAVSSVISRWSKQDPAAAERWALTLRGESRDRALLVLAGAGSGDWSERARLLNAISSDPQRESSAFLLYQMTVRRDGQQQADALLDALDISDEARARLRASRF